MKIIETLKHVCKSSRTERRKAVCSLFPGHLIETDGYSSNIVVPAKNRKNMIVLTAHYDNFPGSLGYNDNGTGMTALIKFHDRNREILPDNVELVFTDHEECGGLGSRLYIDQHANDIQCNINIDVVGYGRKLFYENYGDFPIYLNNKFASRCEDIPFNDAQIFNRNGIPSILLIAGNNRQDMVHDVFMVQHGGPDDNKLELINEDTIETTVKYLECILIKPQGVLF